MNSKTEQMLQKAWGVLRSGNTVIIIVATPERAKELLKTLIRDHVDLSLQHGVQMDFVNLELRMTHGRGQIRFYTVRHPEWDATQKRILSYPPSVPTLVDEDEQP